MTKEKNISIVFVNFDVGFNLGGIADYLIRRFSSVALYKVFFREMPHDGKSEIKFYENGSFKKTLMPYLSTRDDFPLVRVLQYLVVFMNLLNIKRLMRGDKLVLVSPNPYFVFFGNLLNSKTLYVVGDAMRVQEKSFLRRFFTSITKTVINVDLATSTYVWFISKALEKEFRWKTRTSHIYAETLAVSKDKFIKWKTDVQPKILYIGTFQKEKGLNLILRSAEQGLRNFNFVLIGHTGEKIRIYDNVKVLPPIVDDVVLHKIVREGPYIAVAPYYFSGGGSKIGDSTKVKQYLSYGMPVVTTKVIEFSKELEKYHAGLAIDYRLNDFCKSILEIKKNYSKYRNGVKRLLNDFREEKLYDPIFNEIIDECLYAKN